MTINTIVLGATGYVGGELLRLLAGHPEFELAAAVSTSQSGNSIGSVFPHLAATYPEQTFSSPQSWPEMLHDGDQLAVFSAAPHGASAALVQETLDIAADKGYDVHVVDSSADFRYQSADEFEKVYGGQHQAAGLLADFCCGVPEHVAATDSLHVGHPGCFATAMLLASVPLYKAGLLQRDSFISGITGSTGSGKSPQPGTHHPERHSNLYAYKALSHRHVPEVENLIQSATGQKAQINFIPHSGPFARGIYVTVQGTLAKEVSRDEILQALDIYYANADFVQVIDTAPKLKNVVASNYAHVSADTRGDKVVILCAIDNLVKGAAGGAIQWMNRLWSLPESAGLTTPPPAWT